MKIKQLHLVQYRNYNKQEIEFSNNINIFLGENAQGKTNLMEAIYMLALTKSHRTSNEKEVIQWNSEFARLEAIVDSRYGDKILKLIIHDKGKRASIGQVEQKKLSQYVGSLNVVLFAPEDLNIIKGSPSIRRQFIDRDLGQMQPTYLTYLSEYKRLLKQRNHYLKEKKIDNVYLDILTEQLAKQAGLLLYHRLHFVEKLNAYATDITRCLSQQKDELSLHYISSVLYNSEDTPDSLAEKYRQLFQKYQQKEIDNRLTLYGPHRDDLLLLINGKNGQIYGSQGQQRTVVLSLKLAEIDLMKEMTGQYPILLLDDVLSELDDLRQTYLLKTIENRVQTFITTTNLAGIQKNIVATPKIFRIEKGSVHFE